MQDDNTQYKVIGLTGGIGSGKTAATDALKSRGYRVIDADEISRELFARGTDGEKMLCNLFPSAVEGGALDRKKLRELISRDGALREKLNAATHPLIAEKIRDRLAETDPPVILSAPLLIESGLNELCDIVVSITCLACERIHRIMLRDGISEADARAIMSAQATDDERRRASDIVLSSDGSIKQFEKNVLNVFDRLVEI